MMKLTFRKQVWSSVIGCAVILVLLFINFGAPDLAAGVGIAHAMGELAQEPALATLVRSWPIGSRVQHRLHQHRPAVRGFVDREQAKAKGFTCEDC